MTDYDKISLMIRSIRHFNLASFNINIPYYSASIMIFTHESVPGQTNCMFACIVMLSVFLSAMKHALDYEIISLFLASDI